MKCKRCNGTGKVRGYFYEKTGVNKWEKVWGDSPCEECNGTGEIEVANEAWLRQASTEEMEHTLTMLIMKDRFFADKEFAYVNIRFGVHCWLKEIHHAN